MESRNVEIVTSSFGSVYAQKAALAEHFYRHLFTELPHVKPYFNGGVSKQKEMFSIMLAAAVGGLTDERDMSELCEGLKVSHSAFGLGSYEAEKTTESLMKAFQEVLGSEFDREMEHAWGQAIARVVRAMV